MTSEPASQPAALEPKAPARADESPAPSRRWTVAILVLILLATAAVRWHLRAQPLERDEGEYAYAGQLLLKGIPPYQLAYNMKFPGTYAAYATLLALFGQTATGIHLGFLLVNAATILLVYWFAARLVDERAGLAAAACYAYLSLSTELLGQAAHATHFVVLAAVPGWILLERGLARRSMASLFFAGVFLGLSVLMKQHGIFFVLFAAVWLVWKQLRPRNWRPLLRATAAFGYGVVAPLALTALLLWKAGVLDKFWFWTIQYAREYAGNRPPSREILHRLFQSTPRALYPALYIALAGLFVLWRKADKSVALFAAGLLGCSLVAIFPNFNFRPHYYILLLPALSLLVGAAFSAAREFCRQRRLSVALPALVGMAALGLGLLRERTILFHDSPEQISRKLYNRSAFPESLPVADYLKAHAAPDARIAVLGSEPQIYFYSQRLSATGYIYTYALMEPQPFALRMQKEMIAEIEAARPEYVVYVEDGDSWIVRFDSEHLILDWARDYLAAHYEPVGLVEIFPDNHTVFHWDNPAPDLRPQSDVYLSVLRRKP